MKILKKDSNAILQSLVGGVVPSRGLHHILVGRSEEAQQIMKDLEEVKEGSSFIKFFIGDFGTGKSFIQGLVKQIALKQKFVVSNADFTPERRLYGNDRKAVALYNELLQNLSTSSAPSGNALSSILDKWLFDVQKETRKEHNIEDSDVEDAELISLVADKIKSTIEKMDELSGGYDFAQVLSIYYKGYVESDDTLQRSALRWLRGEYGTKLEARKDLGVRNIIDDNNYYSYLKILSLFVKQVGYSGLVLNLDEAINIYKITHPHTRDKNYETILKIYNDTLQGNLEGLYVTIGGTVEFLEDERKGMYSYGALRRRLETNKFETKEFRDLTQPVIKLSPLNHNDIFVLLQKLVEIHAQHYSYKANVTQDEIMNFIKEEYSAPGAEEHLTVGHIIRDFLNGLNILHQNPEYDKSKIFSKVIEENNENDELDARFSTL